MIVYRDVTREIATAAALLRLGALARRGDAAGYLLELGELEQGVVDALQPEHDGWSELLARLRDASIAAGAAFAGGSPGGDCPGGPPGVAVGGGSPGGATGRSPAAGLPDLRARLGEAAVAALPRAVRVTAPEGYTHYALDPAVYMETARRYIADVGREAAARAVVMGVRSIGTGLSAVVAAVCGSGASFTVRPRGASGGRRIVADGRLVAYLHSALARGGDVLVVDEGPGVTGETFACAAAWLREQGVAAGRIVLFPSHGGGMRLAPEARRAWYDGARKYVPAAREERAARIASRLGMTDLRDLWGGRWRQVVPGAEGLPACTGFERLKYRVRDRRGRFWQIRYGGAGRWGESLLARADVLAALGLQPAVAACDAGFLVWRWIEGKPVRRTARPDAALLTALDDYLAARAGHFRTGEVVDVGGTLEAFLENAAALPGADPDGVARAARLLARLPPREAVIADARLQPREWLRTPHGRYVKVDALDHGYGFRLPGPTDSAWDLAGAAVEFGLDPATLSRMTARCARAGGEDPRELAAAVAAYRAPYAATAYAEAALSALEADSPEDRGRLEAEAAHYGRALAAAVGRDPGDRRMAA